MLKIKINKNDLNDYLEGSDNDLISKALSEEIEYQLDEMLRYDNIEVNDIVDITKFYSHNDVEFKIKLSEDSCLLLSLATDLDDVWFYCQSELWNNIVLDDENRVRYGFTEVYDEAIWFLFKEIEEDIAVDNDFDIDINYYIEHFEFKDLIDKDGLYEYIEKGIEALKNLIDKSIENYMEIEYFELIEEIEDNILDYMYDEIHRHGYYECYV